MPSQIAQQQFPEKNNQMAIVNVHFGAFIYYIRSEPCVLSKLELQRGKFYINSVIKVLLGLTLSASQILPT